MSWFSSHLKSSLMSLLGTSEVTSSVLEDRTEGIRQLILDELDEAYFPTIARRVRYATDAQGLWHARGDVMAALAEMHGESIAREKISLISEQFTGLLPSGLSARPSSLAN